MNVAELADHWDAEADTCEKSVETTRSLDAYVRERARAQQLRWCAAQLRLVTQPPVIVKFDGQMDGEQLAAFRAGLLKAVRNAPSAEGGVA